MAREVHYAVRAWQLIFSVIGAIAVGITAFLRVTTTALAAPKPSRRGTVRA